MESTNSKHVVGYAFFGVLIVFAFALGYLAYPKLNEDNIPLGMHQMPNNNMMGDEVMHQNMSMGQMMDAMSMNLKGKTGNDFDSAFLEEMIPHHLGAIEMARMVLATSKRPELIKLANEIISAQQKEIETMRGWQRTWFGVQPQ